MGGVRWIRSIVATAALAAAIGTVAPDVALAHAGLESSTPAASSVLEQSPPLISLDFDEDIDVPLTSIQLFAADRSPVALGSPAPGADGTVVEATVPALADGTYAVLWRISSADGHVETGAFSFQVGTASTADGGELIRNLVGGVRADPSVGRALGIARFAAFVGVALLLGGLVMVMMAAGTAEIGWPARRLLWIGWLLLLVGSLANFGLLGAGAAAGSLRDALDSSLWGGIADTRTGGLLRARLALLLMLGGVLIEVDARKRVWWQTVVPLVGVLTIFTFSGGGHPSVQRIPLLWIGVDGLHLAMIAVWLGGLAMMLAGGRVWLGDDSHAVAVRTFSKLATVAVPLIVVTGVLQAWRLGGGFDALTDTTWGRLLLAKGTLVVLVVTIGAASRWLLANDGPSALRRTVVTEALIGVVVLGLAAGMVALPPRAVAQNRVFTASLTEAGVIVDVSITPGHVGANEIHVVVVPPGGGLEPVADLTAQLSLPSDGIPDTPVTLVAESGNHYSGTVTLESGGDWNLGIVVSPKPNQSILLSTTVPIP